MRGVDGVCEMCVWLRVAEWMRGLVLSFINPVGTGGVRRASVLHWCKWGVGMGLGPGSGAVVLSV